MKMSGRRFCNKTQQNICLFIIGTIFIVLGMLGLLWSPSFIENIIDNKSHLSKKGNIYEKWLHPPVPIYMNVYLYNWTNPEEVLNQSLSIGNVTKPNFERLGPYVFREERHKENIVWNENQTVSYSNPTYWYFEPEMSGGKLDDFITAPHVPSIAASNLFLRKSIIIKKIFNKALNNNGGTLYQTHMAKEWLFDGFYDTFLDFATKLNNSLSQAATSDHFAWFLERNGSKTFSGIFTVNTGEGNLNKRGNLEFWNGSNHSGFFEDECGKINGSTSDIFPAKLQKHNHITLFIQDACRYINFYPTNRVNMNGLEVIRYEIPPDTFDNGDLNPNMKCFCPKHLQPNECPKSGVTDLGACYNGAPVYISKANFMHADPSYANTITGLEPNPNSDYSFIILEPKLGVPVQVNISVQISLLIQPDSHITILKEIPNLFYAPMLMVNTKAKIESPLINEIKLVIKLPDIGFYIGLSLLILGIILNVIFLYLTLKRKFNEKNKKFLKSSQEINS